MLTLTLCLALLQDESVSTLVERLADPRTRTEAMTHLLRRKRTAHDDLRKTVDAGIANADAARAARRALSIFDCIDRIVAETNTDLKSGVMKELARFGAEGAVAATQWLRDNAAHWQLDPGYIEEALRCFGAGAIDALVDLLASLTPEGREGTARASAINVLAQADELAVAASFQRVLKASPLARAGASSWLRVVGATPNEHLAGFLKKADLRDDAELETIAALAIRRTERHARTARRFEFGADKKEIEATVEEGEEFHVAVPYDGGPVFPSLSWEKRVEDPAGAVLGTEQLPRAGGQAAYRFVAIRPGKNVLSVSYGGGAGPVPEAGSFRLTIAVEAAKADARVDRLTSLLQDHWFDAHVLGGIVARIGELGEKRLTGDLVRLMRPEWASLFQPALEKLTGRRLRTPAEWRAWWKENGK